MKTLLDSQQIQTIIQEMARQINKTYQGQELVIVGVLKGAFLFMSDLIRQLQPKVYCDFVRISSYRNQTSSGELRLEFDLTQPVQGKHVLVLEDVVDTGKTIHFVKEHLLKKQVASLKFATLLLKKHATAQELVDFYGKVIPNDYVVGYGMDFQGLYRNLPQIQVLSLTNW